MAKIDPKAFRIYQEKLAKIAKDLSQIQEQITKLKEASSLEELEKQLEE